MLLGLLYGEGSRRRLAYLLGLLHRGGAAGGPPGGVGLGGVPLLPGNTSVPPGNLSRPVPPLGDLPYCPRQSPLLGELLWGAGGQDTWVLYRGGGTRTPGFYMGCVGPLGSTGVTRAPRHLGPPPHPFPPSPLSPTVGPLHVSLAPGRALAGLERANAAAGVEPGGRWRPPSCLARSRTAVLVPHRGREPHLRLLLQHLHPLLQRQQLRYGLYVVHQVRGAQMPGFSRGGGTQTPGFSGGGQVGGLGFLDTWVLCGAGNGFSGGGGPDTWVLRGQGAGVSRTSWVGGLGSLCGGGAQARTPGFSGGL